MAHSTGVVYKDLRETPDDRLPGNQPGNQPYRREVAHPTTQEPTASHPKAHSTGVVYKDLLPTPDDRQAVNQPYKREVAHSITQEPTASHALAMAQPEIMGAAQLPNNEEVKDLGWNEPKEDIVAPLVGGLDNETLWLLVRRFNKVS